MAGRFFIRGDAAGDDHADIIGCPLREIGSHALKSTLDFLEAGVHRTHDRTVLDGGEAEIERL